MGVATVFVPGRLCVCVCVCFLCGGVQCLQAV